MESENDLINDYMLNFWDWNTGAWIDERVTNSGRHVKVLHLMHV